jgi:hypothetical protein
MVVFIGVGGGSDLASCEILAHSFPSRKCSFITVMRPLTVSGVSDMTNTVLKYTGKPYMQSGTLQFARGEYAQYAVDENSECGMYFRHKFKPNTIGILLGGSELIETSAGIVRDLFLSDPDRSLIAVDTGGDSLRSLVPGMGDQDISDVLDGSIDSRDADSLRLACDVVSGPVRLYVFGPGADGETSQAGLDAACDWISSESAKVNSQQCRFVDRIPITSLAPFFPQVLQWANPVPGSTIWNILRALDADATTEISIIRREKQVSTIQAKFLQHYWVFDINCIDNK